MRFIINYTMCGCVEVDANNFEEAEEIFGGMNNNDLTESINDLSGYDISIGD